MPERAPRLALSRAAIGALLALLALTAALAVTALAVYEHNEKRLLHLKAREFGFLISSAVATLQTPLASAAELADVTGGDAAHFKAFMAPYVGPGREFASASLWPLAGTNPRPEAIVGAQPALASRPQEAASFFTRARHASALVIVGILQAPSPSLGYAYSSPAPHGGFAAYAEIPLPKDRRSRIGSQSAFSDLNYALYLGRGRNPQDLLVSNMRHFPIEGQQASDVVPFGESAFTLVVTPHESLGGTFFESLPWIIGLIGTLVALAACAMTERLVRRRRFAEELASDLDRVAAENRRLYTEQRSIAQTLQHALLPDALPELDGLSAHARYVPAGQDLDVGGDWYDVHALDGQRVLLIVGDVSGHGLEAATTMASLRHAALAYAAEGCRPAELLERLARFAGGGARSHFATVMCALLEREQQHAIIASAGHPPPLIIDESGASFVELKVGPPIGVVADASYEEIVARVAPGSIFLAYTDGLIERRGEVLDVGLARLRDAAVRDRLPTEELLGKLTEELSSRRDDTAIVGIEWQT